MPDALAAKVPREEGASFLLEALACVTHGARKSVDRH